MKAFLTAILTVALGAGIAVPTAAAAEGDNIRFPMVVSSGASTCLPHATGKVTISDLGPVQNMHIEVSGLPPKTEFDTFVIQVPNKPFGLVWYQGDIDTDKYGQGVGDFTGVFSKETFINGPGVAPAPKIFDDDATSNPETAPVQVYHLGIWFNSP